MQRCLVRHYNTLTIHLASRLDQIHFKLYAAADHGPRSKHVVDLQALSPTRSELLTAAKWCRTQDPSDGFRGSLSNALNLFGVKVADGEL